MYTLNRKDKELIKGNLREVMFYFFSIHNNIWHALAYQNYSVLKNGVKIELTSEEKNQYENEYKNQLLDYRVNKIKDIINALNLELVPDNNSIYELDNIHIYGLCKENNQQIRFSMFYNNKNKIQISPFLIRDKQNNFVDYYEYKDNCIDIYVSIDRELDKIVKDINKRFMIDFMALSNRHIEKVKNINNEIDKNFFNMQYIKGESLTEQEKKSKELFINKEYIHNIKFYGDNVRIDLYSMPVDKAKKIIDILTKE